MENKYKCFHYGVGERLDVKMSGEGSALRIGDGIIECVIALKNITQAEKDAVSKGIIKVHLSYIEGFAFICLGIGDNLIYELPLESHKLLDEEVEGLKDGIFMPIVLMDFDTNIVQAIRAIGFDKAFSKKIYNMIVMERQNISEDYEGDVLNLFLKYTTKEIIEKSFAKQIFPGEYPMKYSKQSIIEDIKSGKPIEYLFFYGHKKNAESIGDECLSQWYDCKFTINGRTIHTAEQYMMSQKAAVFGDKETFKKIMSANHPKQYKALGRQIKNFNQETWDKAKYKIVLDGNLLKFSQNEELKQFLLSTGDKILVEASPYDKVWGIGMSAENFECINPGAWNGENLLGFALMEVRDILKNGGVIIH